MLLSSFGYLVFLSLVALLYYSVPNNKKYLVLLSGSLFFVGWLSINILAFTLIFITLNYVFGIVLYRNIDKPFKRKLFLLFISVNILILAFYKYINFFIDNINALLSLIPTGHELKYIDVIIPVGISYYTFQSIGYLIRISRGNEKAEKNFGIFALLLMFFPKFLAGPVERSNHFIPQIKELNSFNYPVVIAGLKLFLLGLFKKVVIGDNLAGLINHVYAYPDTYQGLSLILTMFLQTIQLYADFSGYTDMALGSAKVLGIDLLPNFQRPFMSKNITELWRRWHMSLSLWCNDYIFKPIMIRYRKLGNRAAVYAVFVTFFIIGIWHGANWTFVVLGLLQGIAITYEFYTKRYRARIKKKMPSVVATWLSRFITFTYFSFSLIFFNSPSLTEAFQFINKMFFQFDSHLTGYFVEMNIVDFLIAMISFAALLVYEVIQENGYPVEKWFSARPVYFRWSVYYILILLTFVYNTNENTFVYLQF